MIKPSINSEWIADNCTEVHHYMLRCPVEAWDTTDVYDPYYLDRDDLFSAFRRTDDIVYFCGQSEMADNYEHYQLYIIAKRELSTSIIRRLLYPVKFKVNLYFKKCSDVGKSLNYCIKADTRLNGPWEGSRRGTGDMKIRYLLKQVNKIDSYLEILLANLESERT